MNEVYERGHMPELVNGDHTVEAPLSGGRSVSLIAGGVS
jgi:hypothetical protein